MKHPIVTMTTDFGRQDYYLPRIKGAMLAECPALNIVDITHSIKNYDIVQAAFIFRNAWNSFPDGTIHLVSVNDFSSQHQDFIAIRHQKHHFIGPDNGIFSLVFDETPSELFQLEYSENSDFPLKDVYAIAVGHIARGLPFHEIGLPVDTIVQRLAFQPVISHSQIRGSVIHIDNFENVILNITRKLFDQVCNDRDFALYFKRHDPIRKLSRQYNDVPVGETLCLFNSAGYIEIAINMGKAGSLLGLKMEDTVQIDFHSKQEPEQ